ncbi:MAG: TIGR01777 family protein [Propionibacteriales bacterium]|nr:TIGR01777 family protein [Propionibacteriales bacterium]
MRYVIAGSSGFLGTALRDRLAGTGHEVLRLVRRQPSTPDESRWDPYSGDVDRAVIESADAVVNLVGAPLARLWTASHREAIRTSRVASTRTLAQAIADSDPPPLFLAQSAIGIYGNDRGDTVLDETSPSESGAFLQSVVVDWEAATNPAKDAGARVLHMRTGVVIHRSGGALGTMLPVFRLGLGGKFGSGAQYFSVISLVDWVEAVIFLAELDNASGIYNLTAPDPPTNAEWTTALGRALHRPTRLTVPAFALKPVGELSGEVLGSLRVVPSALLTAGFEFRHPTVDEVAEAALR